MNELQISLIGVGIAIVIGVIAYNGWQGRRARARRPRPRDDESGFPAPVPGERDDEEFIVPRQSSGEWPSTAAESRTPLAPQAPERVERREPGVGGVGGVGGAGKLSPAARREPSFGASVASNSVVDEGDAIGAARLDASTASAAGAGEAAEIGESPIAGAPSDATGREDGPTGPASGPAPGLGGNAAHGAPPDTAPAPAREPERLEPELGGLDALDQTQTISSTPPSVIDRRIDCIVPLRLGERIAAERVLPLAVRFRRAGGKPVFVEGRADEAQWDALQAGQRYDELRVSVQMANRAGPLNELGFSEFASGVHRLADAIDAVPEFPDMMEVVSMARELDGFAAQCDAQLSVNVLSDGAPWSANYVQAVASRDGMLLSRDGTRFVKLDANRNPVFMLQFEGVNFLRDDLTYKGGHMITLLLDVPVADEDILPFRLLCDYARSLAERIGARVVDDQRRVLPESALLAIEKRLMTIYGKLEQAGLPAGSPLARRLFSA